MKKLCNKKRLSNISKEAKQEFQEIKKELVAGAISALVLGGAGFAVALANADFSNTAEVMNSVGLGCTSGFLGLVGGIVYEDLRLDIKANKQNQQLENEK